MCLAIPGQIIEVRDPEPLMRTGLVAFGAITAQVSLACVPEAVVGDFVLVHAGIAISRVDAEEAARTLDVLADIAAGSSDPDRSP